MRLSEKKRLNLQRRRKDYDEMMKKQGINPAAYKKPGSLKK